MKRIFRRPDATRDVGDELRFHIDMRAREFMDAGLSPDEARRAATQAFGDVSAIDTELLVARTAHTRARARRDWLHELARDVAFAIRTLRKNAGFTTAALATPSLGIGAAIAVFTVVDGVLLHRVASRMNERAANGVRRRRERRGRRAAIVRRSCGVRRWDAG